MRLTINLATRRYINLPRLNALLVAGFVLVGGLLLFKVREIAYKQSDLARIASLSAAADRRPGEGPAVGEAQLKELAAQTALANALIEKKSVNWLYLLDSLEEVVPEGVAITQLDPGKRDRPLKLSGIARSFANVRVLMENLEQSKKFSDVFLMSQAETKVGQTQHGVSFTITCKVNYR
jgi:type IV pilus assembly protein PilN